MTLTRSRYFLLLSFFLSGLMVAGCTRFAPAPVIDKGGQSAGRAASAVQSIGVRPGDTVYKIARRTGVSVRALIAANKLSAPFLVKPGQKLKLPAAAHHVVVGGDTVYDISRAYGVGMTSLMRLNRLKPPYTIKIGQKLLLPGEQQMVAVASAVKPSGTKTSKAKSSKAKSSTAKSAKPKPRTRPKRRAKAKPPPPRSGSRFGWPVKGSIISKFGPKSGGLYNDGINIAAKRGSPLRASENGVVAYAGNELRGFGNLLLIRHKGGWMTAYAHADKLLVRQGETVKRGQTIARVGSSGSVKSPQVHFEIRKGSQAVDPVKYLTALDHRPKRRTMLAWAGEN